MSDYLIVFLILKYKIGIDKLAACEDAAIENSLAVRKTEDRPRVMSEKTMENATTFIEAWRERGYEDFHTARIYEAD